MNDVIRLTLRYLFVGAAVMGWLGFGIAKADLYDARAKLAVRQAAYERCMGAVQRGSLAIARAQAWADYYTLSVGHVLGRAE